MYRYLLIFLLFFSGVLTAQDLFFVKSAKVTFTSDAPLELIEASSGNLQGVINTTDKTFAFRILMNTFEGFNSSLQKTHFNANYLETAQYPYTIFEGIIIEDIDFSKAGSYNIRGKGRFTCHGVEEERIIKCNLQVTASSIQISSEFTVLLDDHQIKIPSVVHQKIAEEIVVAIEAKLLKK